ncbi:SH3 domain-containing protein [Streptomyces sp. NPDC005134]|uniref:SH3 domain-containing protein n=2 Tax=Streptomyces TaxID=1883 RepID=UPI003448CFF2
MVHEAAPYRIDRVLHLQAMRKMISVAYVAGAALLLPFVGVPTVAAASVGVMAADFNSCGYEPRSTMRLRSGPGEKYVTIGLLHRGDSVSTLQAKGAWYKVSLDGPSSSGLKSGRTGWVDRTNLRPNVCVQLN